MRNKNPTEEDQLHTRLDMEALENPESYIRKQLALQKQYVGPREDKFRTQSGQAR